MGTLTAKEVQTAEIELGKTKKISDGGGLYLLINKSGKYWRYNYRFVGKQKDSCSWSISGNFTKGSPGETP